MAKYPPYMSGYGYISRIFKKAKTAKTPDRFTQDFVSTQLSIKSSGARPFVSFAKRIGLLNSDGSPTELYNKFRSTNDKVSGAAIAKALRSGYSDVYSKNEYAHDLNNSDLKGLIIELTGLESKNPIVKNIIGSFNELKKYADFDAEFIPTPAEKAPEPTEVGKRPSDDRDVDLNISYTINLVLPKTDDIDVFNAIFKSLRENLLRK